MLEDKIKEYLERETCCADPTIIKWSHDIAEIVKANQKHLNRAEVEKIIKKEITKALRYVGLNPDIDYEQAITAICELAIQPVTKDRIIEVLDQYKITWFNIYDVEMPVSSEEVASEILERKEGE